MRFSASVRAARIHDRSQAVVQRFLKFKDYGLRCASSVLINVLFYAASRMTSLFDACQRIADRLSAETLRKALISNLPDIVELERRINKALRDDLPKCVCRTPQKIAIDLFELPYHGQPQRDPQEVCRGKARSGTTHFHTYASACVVRKGQRFTLAMTQVRKDEPLTEVLQRLLAQIRRCHVKIAHLLLDLGFYSIEVIRFLQAGRHPFLMPLKMAGRIPREISDTNPRRFLSWKRSGWSEHRLHNAAGQTATVDVCVSCRESGGRFGNHRRQTFVYACWGFKPRSPAAVRDDYRKRFGIESSYRQAHQGLIVTSSRDPLRRLLFVALVLICRNVWVWFHLCVAGIKHGNGITLRLGVLRFRQLLQYLEQCAEFALQERPPTAA
jgi:putative transposase